MGPKKNKNKNQDQDEQFQKKQKNLQNLLKQVQKKQNKNKRNTDEQDEQQIQRKKQVFNWQLKKKQQKALKLKQEKQQKRRKQKQQKLVEQRKLTQEQKVQLQKKLQKQKIEKQQKRKKQQEKRLEREKIIQQEKIQQQKKKQQEQKQNEQIEKKLKTPANNGKCLPIVFLIFIFLLFGLQYQKQIYTRLSKFKLDGEENFYEIFQIDSGATDRELKEKYKRLVLKYHPDKNPNCVECQDKFNKIIKAWQIIGNTQKRKHYDANSGFVTQIKSQSITLTPLNYEQLIQQSRSLWMIQVYDSTQKYCHYFSQFWEDIVRQHGKYIKFGRVDIWTQSNMLSYLPYKFQVFPSIYFYHKGEIGLCEFDFQQPDWSIRRCIQSQYKENLIKPLNSLTNITTSDKPSIIFTDKVKIGTRFKIINRKYQTDFNFYLLNQKSNQSQIIAIFPNGENRNLKYGSSKQNQFYDKYQKFLESLILQSISICELISRCQSQPCFIMLPQNAEGEYDVKKIPRQNNDKFYPVFKIKQNKRFFLGLEDLKNKTGIHQKFELGLYQNGHIDLGYFDESQILNVEDGQNFQQLECIYEDRSWIGKITKLVKGISQLF